MGKKKMMGGFRRFLASALAASMLFADIVPSWAAGADAGEAPSVLGAGISDEELRAALAQEAGEWPDGGFEFFESRLTAEEGQKQQLVIVRGGGTEQEATVDFKAVDVSAVYGEDYLLTVNESGYFSKTLDGKGKPLSDLNTELQSTGENVQQDPPEAGADAPREVPQVWTGSELQTVSASRAVKKKTSGTLQAAKDTYLGTQSSSLNWQELDEAQKAEAEAQSAAYEQAYDEFAEDMYGIYYTFTFKPGEYKKTVDIETFTDGLSEGDEQVMFLLSNASAGEIAGTSTAYLNITDNSQ